MGSFFAVDGRQLPLFPTRKGYESPAEQTAEVVSEARKAGVAVMRQSSNIHAKILKEIKDIARGQLLDIKNL